MVEALERLKVPDESIMGAAELACWRENKKTIMNSLKTLSRCLTLPPRDACLRCRTGPLCVL